MNYSIIVIKATHNLCYKRHNVMIDGLIKVYLKSACSKGKADLELLEYLDNFLVINQLEV